jgi:N utilization substance protein B
MPSPLTLRKKARELVLQALYQQGMSDEVASEIQAQFLTDNDINKFDVPYFNEIFLGVMAERAVLDAAISQHTTRPFDQISPIECAILRLSTFEMLHRLDIPYRVVINEALELAKSYGATDGFKFVNGILDKIARENRPDARV